MANDSQVFFALNTIRVLCNHIAEQLGAPLCPHEEREFDDGEHKSRPLISVRGKDCYVLQSLNREPDQSTNDKLCRLLFFIGALKDAGAHRVTTVIPYLAYARKDHKTQARDPVTTRYVAQLFEAVGTDTVVAMDVHNLVTYQNAFRCQIEHFEATKLLTAHVATRLAKVVVVSPDAGGIKCAEQFRQRLSPHVGHAIPMAVVEKYRSGGVLSGGLVVGDVKNRHVILIDDLISSGSTLVRAATACRSQGAVSVVAMANHGLFTHGAAQVLSNAVIDSIVTTDSVSISEVTDKKLSHKLVRLSCAELFAQAISRLHSLGSMVDIMA